MPYKNTGGRPKKYASVAEARQANIEGNRRRRRLTHPSSGPADFIAFEPSLPSDVPAPTHPEIGLRVSQDIQIPIRIPPGRDIQECDFKEPNTQPYPVQTPPQATDPLGIQEEADIIRRVREIQRNEHEDNIEEEDYDAEVTARLKAMTAADHEAAEALRALQGGCTGRQSSLEAEPQRFDDDILQFDDSDFDLSVQQNSNILLACHIENSIDIQKSQQPNTPTNNSLPSQHQSSRSRSGRSTLFPAQKNTLLSWMKPRAEVYTAPPTQQAISAEVLFSSPSPSNMHIYSEPNEAPPIPIVSEESFTNRASIPRASAGTPSPTNSSASPDLERTAFKLAKQLRNFQGCTYEQHLEADHKHQEHHQRPDVHSKCSSLSDVTLRLRGSYAGGMPLPDVLSSGQLMKATDFQGADAQAAFEGTSRKAAPEDIATRNDGLPQSLCLSQHYSSSKKNRQPQVTFDIDSICCFPTSLGFARHGINWMPKVHSILNLTADIHFGLKVPGYTLQGRSSEIYVPLHKIPHYCFGTVIGMEELLMFIFFPALRKESDHEHTTYLSKNDQELWLDAILIPSITKTVGSSNILQYYPASARIADIDSTAVSAEGLARKESAREQLLRHTIQPQYLDALWTLILKVIDENPGFHRFQGATLFTHAKNTKLESMGANIGLTEMYDKWEQRWAAAVDEQFFNKNRTYVDLAKQTTSEDSALPFDRLSASHEAEVFLWKRCCLDAYAQTRTLLKPDGSKAKGNPKRTTYPWATMRDTMGQTLFAAPQGGETQDGLIYSQFYGLIKTPFDSTKVYIFDNDAVENLSLDPGYIRSLQQEGGGITFSKGVCQFAYLHSKRRAYANLLDNQWRSYGIREEHRISLTMMEEIYQQWRQWDLYDAEDIDANLSPLPYYIVPTKELLSFLYAQINKYCFLFEHVLAHTGKTYSLPETIVMVVALRALRFCYGGNLLGRESLLYKDHWEILHDQKTIIKEGLGMRKTIEQCGIGWFLPKFNWATWRLAAPSGDNILVGNLLMHEEYKRRWRAVKDLRDVYVRFNQAESWYDQYNMQSNSRLLKAWLEYLQVLNIEQFDMDVWKAMAKASKSSSRNGGISGELGGGAIIPEEGFRFCYHDMKKMFLVNGVASPPHLVTGNKMRFEKVMDLLNFLFLWDDEERLGWDHKPYRVILKKTFELVERRLGYQRADAWLDKFLHLVRLTHWVLPYPSNRALITSTKTNHSQGLKRRMMWFSVVYADPGLVELPLKSSPSTLNRMLWHAQRQRPGDRQDQRVWKTSQLIAGFSRQGMETSGNEECWVAGKKSVGLKGYTPLWERGRPSQLKMLEQIKKKTLDELEELMAGLSQRYTGQGGQDNEEIQDREIMIAGTTGDREDDADQLGEEVVRRGAAVIAGKSIMAAFGRKRSVSNNSEEDIRKVSTPITVSNVSIYIPSSSRD